VAAALGTVPGSSALVLREKNFMHGLNIFSKHPSRESWMLPKDVSRTLSAASFWVPEYICGSAWTEHAPFAFWLVNALRPRRFVELGTYQGYSYFSFCQAVQRIGCDTSAYAIDTWSGDEHGGFYDDSVYEAAQEHNQARYSGFSTLIRSTFAAALPYFQDRSVDLLHVDGRHYYEDVKQDFLQWAPKLAPHAIVLFHDTNVRERNFGVWRFFKELSAERRTFEFYHGNGLGVVANDAVPETLKPLFSAGLESSGEIRALYAALGQALSARRASIEKAEAVGASARTADLERLQKAQMAADLRTERQDLRARMAQMAADLRTERQDIRASMAQLIAEQRRSHRELENRLSLRQQELNEAACQLAAIQDSTSWKMTFPIRRVLERAPRGARVASRRTAELVWWTMTGQVWSRLRTRRQPLARKAPQHAPTTTSEPATSVAWDQRPAIPVIKEAARPIEIDYSLAVPLRYVDALKQADGPVATVVHMFYADLAVEIRRYLENIPGTVDVFISTTNEFEKALVEKAFAGWSPGGVEVRIVPNRGRDVAPRLVAFRHVYDRYAYVLQLHTKQSLHSSVLRSWRHFLLESLVGDEAVVSSVFEAFARNPRLGIVAAQHFEPLRHWINWGNNLEAATRLAASMGISVDPDAALDFPSGSMFWARTAALRPLIELGLTTEEFDEEQGQKDHTLAHAIERLPFHVCERAGFDWIKVARPEFFAHTPMIVSVRDATELDGFFERLVFRLHDPKEVRPRNVPPKPILEAAAPLLDAVRDNALGRRRVISAGTRAAIGMVTYDNEDAVLRLGAGAARVALDKAGLPTARSVWVLDNGRSSEAVIPADEAVVRLSSQGNIGFGAGHNVLMQAAFAEGADIYVAVNPDGALHPDAIGALVRVAQTHCGRALVEALQFPMEHPKTYDPETLDTSWVSGACMAIPRKAFDELGGFDEAFFMYCEDVDLSWRARACGFALKTCPQALYLHTVTNRDENLRTRAMMFSSGVVLARKWGSPEFVARLRSELAALGTTVPGSAPLPVPKEWRRYADFDHHFSFAEVRW
jgi:GT2 family glycosyltransferase